jgi:hypothetical protein
MGRENREHELSRSCSFLFAICDRVDGRRKTGEGEGERLPNLGFLAGNGTVLYNGRHAQRSINTRSNRKVMNQTCRYPGMFNDEENRKLG